MRAGIELALHGEAERKHGDDGDGEQRAADPFAEEKMAGAGDEPPGNEGKVDESFLHWFARGKLVWGGGHSFIDYTRQQSKRSWPG